jgi:hypothetical protein
MEFIKGSVLTHLIELLVLVAIYYILLFLFKRFNYKITKEKTAQLAVLILVIYFVLSIVWVMYQI